MKKNMLCCALISLLSSYAFAQENRLREEPMPNANSDADIATSEPATPLSQGARYSCINGGAVRRIEIEYESMDSTLPCSVNYYKDNESPGHNVTLWRAEKSEGFCESKAAGFVEKLRAMNWECTES